MLKKVILGIAFIGLTAVLVVGAVNRTIAKNEDSPESEGRGRAQIQSDQDIKTSYRGAGGQGAGGGRSTAENARQSQNYQTGIAQWEAYQGVVKQLPSNGVELTIESTGEAIVVGTGPLSLAELGLDVQAGDTVEIRGYWQDGEFKAAEISDLASGQTAVLRDAWGRPVWSGSTANGRNSQSNQAPASDRTVQAGERGGRGNGSSGRATAEGQTAPALGQVEVEAWLTLAGVVDSIDESALVVMLDSGESMTIEGRPWQFALEQGFTATSGDGIAITGFYEGDSFQAGQLVNTTTGLLIEIRQETGRPLWAGGGKNS